MPMKYVALGDSTVEGLEDPGPDGVYVGWADRLAGHLAAVHDEVYYANLGVRGLTASEVRATQLEAALALRPDLAVVVAGVNDVLQPRFDAAAVRADLFAMHTALRDAGARVLTFTMPDMTRVAPLAVLLRGRLRTLNRVTHELGQALGSTVVDLAAEPVATDPGLWHDDRLHANSEGHRRIAAALAEAVGLEAEDWRADPGETVAGGAVRIATREAAWLAGHFGPWLWGRLRGHPFDVGDGAKRPDLTPLSAPALDSTE